MVKLNFRLIFFLVLIALLSACGNHTTAPASRVTISIDHGSGPSRAAGINIAQQPVIASLVFTVSAPDMTTISQIVSISTQTTVEVTFNVPTGNQRLFVVEAKDQGGTTIYFGSTTTNLDGTPTTLTIDMTLLIPSTPTGVTATPGNGQITIGWASVSGASSYNIYWSTTAGVTKATGTKIPDVSSPYVYTGLTNGTPYYFIITAVNSAGESIESNQVSATPTAAVSPSPPTGVSAIAGDGQVTLAWTSVSGATSYNVYWSLSSGVTTTNGTKITNASNPYVQTGLTNFIPYYYVITAVNAFGESPASAEVSATPTAFISIPTAPTGFSATARDGQVTISWTPVSGAASYNIYWSLSSGVTTTNGTKITDASSPYVQTGLTNGISYHYVITAVNAFGESPVSAEISATPVASAPAAPATVTATAGNGQVTLVWTVVPGATSYNIYWSLSAGVSITNSTKIHNAGNPYVQTGLTNGIPYYYVVTAVNAIGESPASVQVTATPVSSASTLAAPTGITVIPGNNQITISWNPVSGATSYNIYWSLSAGVTTINGTEIANASSPYVQTGLTNSVPYYYVITAVNAIGESTASAQVTATPTSPASTSVPAAPTGIAVTPGNNQVTITWNPVLGATSYNIYWSLSTGVTTSNGKKVTDVSSPYTPTEMTNGLTYYAVLTAVNAFGESPASVELVLRLLRSFR
jgi:hypothetical protein